MRESPTPSPPQRVGEEKCQPFFFIWPKLAVTCTSKGEGHGWNESNIALDFYLLRECICRYAKLNSCLPWKIGYCAIY